MIILLFNDNNNFTLQIESMIFFKLMIYFLNFLIMILIIIKIKIIIIIFIIQIIIFLIILNLLKFKWV